MKLNTLQRSIFTVLIYIGVFTGLVFLQFSKRERFSETAGPILLSGTYSDAENPKNRFPAELNVSFRGFGFVFGDSLPVSALGSEGGKTLILPKSYERSSRGVRVNFERGVKIDFEAPASGDSFSLSASFSDPALAGVEFPYTLSNASFREIKERSLSVISRRQEYELGMEIGASLDTGRHVVLLKRGDNRLSLQAKKEPVRIVVAVPDSKLPAAMDEKNYKSLIDTYLDKVYRGLQDSRYDSVLEAWKQGSDAARFTEEALIALTAEAYRRGDYQNLSGKLNGIAKNKTDNLSWKSNVYFGNIVRRGAPRYAEIQKESERVSRLVQAKDASVFETPDLVSISLDMSEAGKSQELFRFAAELDPKNLGIRQAVGLMACLVEAEAYLPGDANPLRQRAGLIESKLHSALIKTAEGYFLASDSTRIDIKTQLRAAHALVAWGGYRHSASAAGVGHALMQGVLSQSDDSGILPAEIGLKDKALSSRSGVLLPENVYRLVWENPWYPRVVSFNKQAGQGVWAWTCAPEVKCESRQGQMVISAKFPQGATHFMTIFGLKPFSLIQLYDIPYSPDSEFESYNVSGYLYVRASSTLYLKMKHKSELETVRLTFQ